MRTLAKVTGDKSVFRLKLRQVKTEFHLTFFATGMNPFKIRVSISPTKISVKFVFFFLRNIRHFKIRAQSRAQRIRAKIRAEQLRCSAERSAQNQSTEQAFEAG